MNWIKQTGKYASGEELTLGKVKVGWAGYSAMVSKSDTNKYAASVTLPGLSPITDRYSTQEAAKARVEHTVGVWLAAAGLAPSP